MVIIKKSNAPFFLLFNAFLWGSSYVWSKMLLSFLPRFTILFLCSFGCLLFTIAAFYPIIKTIGIREALTYLKISCFSVLSNTFFIFALQYTTSSNTAFIVQLSVIMTPVLMALTEKRMPRTRILISAGIALSGLFLMTCDFNTFRLNPGDLIALGNALFFSIYLTCLNRNSGKVNPVSYTFIQHAENTIVFIIMAGLFEARSINFSNLVLPIVLVLIAASIFISLATILVQSLAIKHIRPENATLIYTFEPVTAMLLGFLIIGERLNGLTPIAGCLFIFVSVVCSLYSPKIKNKKLSVGTPESLAPDSKPMLQNQIRSIFE